MSTAAKALRAFRFTAALRPELPDYCVHNQSSESALEAWAQSKQGRQVGAVVDVEHMQVRSMHIKALRAGLLTRTIDNDFHTTDV
jgi:hypothetical protein